MIDFVKNKDFLAKINQGDQDAFLTVYRIYATKLFRHVYYRVNQKETAEDLTQQIFFKTWEYLLEPENNIDNLNAFLYKTANNLITDYYRSAQRRNLSLNEFGDEMDIPVQSSVIDDTDKIIKLANLKLALNQINDWYRQLIIWRYLDDLSILEIAKISDKSANAVYVGLHRALKQLQKVIKQYEN